jgi:short-subunit dehydrogenase
MELSTEVSRGKVLIFGATSAIAEATAIFFAKEKYDLYLLARDKNKLEATKEKLSYHGAKSIHTFFFQAEDLKAAEETLNGIFQSTKIDIALIAHGILPEQKFAQNNWQPLKNTIQINSISTLFILEFLAQKMEQSKTGTIAVITSLAAENSNRDNYIYASSKALVSSFLKGFSDRMKSSKVRVLDIRPALVQTPMTEFMRKAKKMSPNFVANAIFRAIIQKQSGVLYVPNYWRFVMLILRNIPSNFFFAIHRLYALFRKK